MSVPADEMHAAFHDFLPAATRAMRSDFIILGRTALETPPHNAPEGKSLMTTADDGIIVQLPDGDLVTLFRSQIPAYRKVNVEELFAAFQTFQASVTRAMRADFLARSIAEARDEFRTFCEIHGLAEHIDWTPPEG